MASMRALARDGKGGVRRFGICQDFSVGLCYQGAWTLMVKRNPICECLTASSFILTFQFKQAES